MNKLNCIKEACQINDIIFKEIINNFNFKTEKDLANYIRKRFRNFKVRSAFPMIIANNSKVIHHKPENKKLKKGFLIIDFGAKYRGYCSDMTRTIFLGKPNKYKRMLYELILNCQKRCIKKLKIDCPYCDLDIYARTFLKNYKPYFVHSLGHGIGKKAHELPNINAISVAMVKKNDIITIEPGIYFKNIGLRIEDTVHIGNKTEILTKSPKNLISIKI